MKKPEEDIIALALELSRHMRRRMTARTQGKKGANMMRCYALSFIKDGDGMTMSSFAESMKISASSASAFVDRLSKEGWVRRAADKKNRKIVHLRITASGEKVLARNQQDKRAFLADILSLIPVADRKHLQRILSHLHHSIASTSSTHH